MLTTHSPIRVVIADDHPVYRAGLARLIRERPELELVAECNDGPGALRAITDSDPDIALLDVRMPGLGGIDILRALRARAQSRTRVVMLSASDDGATVLESVSSGACGYLVKDSYPGEICDALVAVAAGRTVLPAGLHGSLAAEIRRQADTPRALLSARESEVLRLSADGHSTQEIADQLFIGTATVKSHLQHIYEKLGVSNRTSAVAEAMRREILR